MLLEIQKHFGIHQIGIQIIVGDFPFDFLCDFLACLFQIQLGGWLGSAAAAVILVALPSLLIRWLGQNGFPHFFRPPSLRPSEASLEHVDDRLRPTVLFGAQVHHIFRADAVGEKVESHVPHDLARGSHLDDVSKQQIDLRIGPGDFIPAMGHSHAGCLCLQVGVLPSGHFMKIDVGAAGLGRGIKRLIDFTHLFPVIG